MSKRVQSVFSTGSETFYVDFFTEDYSGTTDSFPSWGITGHFFIGPSNNVCLTNVTEMQITNSNMSEYVYQDTEKCRISFIKTNASQSSHRRTPWFTVSVFILPIVPSPTSTLNLAIAIKDLDCASVMRRRRFGLIEC